MPNDSTSRNVILFQMLLIHLKMSYNAHNFSSDFWTRLACSTNAYLLNIYPDEMAIRRTSMIVENTRIALSSDIYISYVYRHCDSVRLNEPISQSRNLGLIAFGGHTLFRPNETSACHNTRKHQFIYLIVISIDSNNFFLIFKVVS